jgi:hypothetical protein
MVPRCSECGGCFDVYYLMVAIKAGISRVRQCNSASGGELVQILMPVSERVPAIQAPLLISSNWSIGRITDLTAAARHEGQALEQSNILLGF